MPRRGDTTKAADGDRGSREPGALDALIGSRMRLRRLLLNISQEQLGEMLGLSFQQIQKYEKGVNRISVGRLFEVASVLGVPLDYFFHGAPNTSARNDAEECSAVEAKALLMQELSDRQGLALTMAYLRIANPSVRRTIVALVQSVAGDTPTEADQPEAKVIPALAPNDKNVR